MRPSRKSVQRQKEALRELTGVRTRSVPVTELIKTINRQTRGWSHYFGHGYWRDAFHENQQPRPKTALDPSAWQEPAALSGSQGPNTLSPPANTGVVHIWGRVSAE